MTKRPALIGSCFTLLLLTVLLASVEGVLRLAGNTPGMLQSVRFDIRDEIHLIGGLIADEEGVLEYDPGMRKRIAEMIRRKASPSEVNQAFPDHERSVHYLVNSFTGADPEYSYDNPFTRMIAALAQRPATTLSSLQRAYLDYSRQPLNRDGFRSIEFENYGDATPAVLLIGDSFTFGYSAESLTASFADRLAAAGFAVYNTGVPAVGPAQYEHVATKYLRELRPDVVVINFYMANDIVWWERRLKPFQFPQYPTNAGFFDAAPRREYFDDPVDAYEYTLDHYRIPDQAGSWLNWLCARTALGTKLWMSLANLGYASRRTPYLAAYDERNRGIDSPTPLSETHLMRAREVADQVGSVFLLVVIPDLPKTVPHDYQPSDIFNELEYHVPDLTLEDYRPAPDGHFNNQGHEKYAEFLLRLIGERLQ